MSRVLAFIVGGFAALGARPYLLRLRWWLTWHIVDKPRRSADFKQVEP